MTNERYDLVVIGSGPAGEKGAAQAAYFGKKVALVEREPVLGGAAANTGTLPSKTLRESALFLSGFRHRELEGLDFRGIKEQVTARRFLARKEIIQQRERDRIAHNLERHHVPVIRGAASFADANTVVVRTSAGDETRLAADKFLIATGSYPFRPAEFDFNDPRVYDSDSILQLREMPPSLLVVGGGVIGCEYACMFAELGIQVTVVEKRDRLLGAIDGEIAAALCQRMRTRGIQVILADSIDRLNYGASVQVQLKSGTTLEVAALLISSGRCGNTASLELEPLGVKIDSRGRLEVNALYQTSLPHIYAAGDVIGGPSLASTAMQQARIAMVHAFNLEYLTEMPDILPYGIYTIPECSQAGATEEELQDKQVNYVAGRATYDSNARGQIIGDHEGFLKLLFRTDDMELLGVHMIGEQATELVHVGLTALLLRAKAGVFIQMCYNYPTLAELYKYATYDAMGQRAKARGQVTTP